MAGKQTRQINKFRSLFPATINVKVERSRDGGFVARINTFAGCITQADSFSELIEMVNDAIRTYFEVPVELIAYMPTYLPSVHAAQILDVFPVKQQQAEIKWALPTSREVISS